MSDTDELDQKKVRRAAERHGYSSTDILLIIDSMKRNTFEKPSAILETILKAPPQGGRM